MMKGGIFVPFPYFGVTFKKKKRDRNVSNVFKNVSNVKGDHGESQTDSTRDFSKYFYMSERFGPKLDPEVTITMLTR